MPRISRAQALEESQSGGSLAAALEYPLSQGQRALWFLHQLKPDSAAYNLAGAGAIPGDSDLEALKRAFRELARRHPALRTTFSERDGEPIQHVIADSGDPIFELDASEWSRQQLNRQLEMLVSLPFDLRQEPPWRVHILKAPPNLGEEPLAPDVPDHLVLLTIHHIISDLWSIAVLMSELGQLYSQEVSGIPARLREPRSSLAEFVSHERELLAGSRGDTSWEFWRETLEGELPPLEFPTDRPRPAEMGDGGARISFRIGPRLTSRLRHLAKDQRVAVPTILLAALQTLLYRYTGQDDILTGFLKSGRSPATARVVGYFVNPIVLRGRFAGAPRFREVLLAAQRSIDASAEHDWYPFPLLVSRLQPARDLSRGPLFQVMFSWQKTTRLVQQSHTATIALGHEGQRADLKGLGLKIVAVPHPTTTFDIIVMGTDVGDELAVTFEYRTELFDESTIRRLGDCFQVVLDSIAGDPDQLVSQVRVLPQDQRQLLLVDWNQTAAKYPEATLHQLIERQASIRPASVALKCGSKRLSYHLLNRGANRLAHSLSRIGVRPGSMVGLCCEPSLAAITGILGILKAGAAYVPIDPNYPLERQAFMLKDVGASALIVHAPVRGRIPPFEGPILDMDARLPRNEQNPDRNFSQSSNPDDLAYVIFTSGSTGQPKGSALAHRGVVNLLSDFERGQPVAPGDACSWWTSMSFDVSVYEIFSALISGGTLEIIPQEMRLDIEAVLEFIETNGIRHAYLPPFLLPHLNERVQLDPSRWKLRRLLVGVEPIPEQLLISIQTQLPDLRIINGYGPSETTICSTLYEIEPGRAPRGKTPIGKPVFNTQIYLLDGNLQPVPLGATGEIFIGGVGLAREYLNRPELTAERFVPDPFRPGSDRRLYRTGDLARYLPDGNLEFCGRIDDQFKINGVRIEPAEIEAALCRHAAIRNAAAVPWTDAEGDTHLVAYLVPSERETPPASELRRYLAESLPTVMHPRTFTVIDELPQTSNGKLDRRRLPAPSEPTAQAQPPTSWPDTPVETTLASIWGRVLGVEGISAQDNFFELGGDSISAMQVVSQAAHAGIGMSPAQLFHTPTISGLAGSIGEQGTNHRHSEEIRQEGFASLTPIQRWFFEQSFPRPQHWNQALLFTTRPSLRPNHLQGAVAALTDHHEALRARFVKEADSWRQWYADRNEHIPFEVVDLSWLPEARQAVELEQAAAARQGSLDLSAGPLCRMAYFYMGPDRPGRLLIVLHHLIVDAYSWRILIEDLETAYGQLERGQEACLPARTTTAARWARYLEERASSSELAREADVWQHLTAGSRSALPPDATGADLAGVANLEGDSHIFRTQVTRRDTRDLVMTCSHHGGGGVQEILLTAVMRAVRRWNGNQALRIDLEGHGRDPFSDAYDLSRTVGWLTSLYPVMLDLKGCVDPLESLTAVRLQLGRIPRGGIGYGILRYMALDRRTREKDWTGPPADVCFNYLGHLQFPLRDGPVSGLATESVGPTRFPGSPRPYPLEIRCAVVEGKLEVEWIYSPKLHTSETIERIAILFKEELLLLTRAMRSSSGRRFNPARSGQPAVEGHRLSWRKNGDCNESRSDQASRSRSTVEQAYPLSPMQQGMVFHSLEAPRSGIYLSQTICSIGGPLDLEAFTNAWRWLMSRHAVLRTCFPGERIDQMVQVVRKEVELPVRVYDWRSLSEAQQSSDLERMLRAQRVRDLELDRAPLWSLALVRTGDENHSCVFSHHHALLDGWSLALLFEEFIAAYARLVRQQDLTGPSVRPYRDFIEWLSSCDLRKAEAFWRAELTGCSPGPLLPARRGVPSRAEPHQEIEARLTTAATWELMSLARERNLTLNTLVQGAWAMLLARRFNLGEVVIGMTVAGRPAALTGSENMIGLFINTLPLRVGLEPSAPLIGWLERLQRRAAEARRYDFAPLSKIQSWSGYRPDRPLFDVILAFENYPLRALPGGGEGGLRIFNVNAVDHTNYALALAAFPGEHLHLKIVHDPTRVARADASEMLLELEILLARMVGHPEKSLSAVGDLPDALGVDIARPSGSVSTRRPAFEPPTGELEKKLADHWQEVLGGRTIGAHDDLFDLGGTSLQAASVVSRIRNDLAEEVPLAAIFEAPTVAQMAAYLDQNFSAGVARLLGSRGTSRAADSSCHRTRTRQPSLVPIQRSGIGPPLFCIHPAGGVVFPYYALARHLGNELPLFGLQDPSLFGSSSSFASVEEMATHYLEEIRKVQPEGPYRLLGWSSGGLVAFEMAQQLVRTGETVDRLFVLDTQSGKNGKAGAKTGSLAALRQELGNRLTGIRMASPPIASYVQSGIYLLAASARHARMEVGVRSPVADLIASAAAASLRRRWMDDAGAAVRMPELDHFLTLKLPEVGPVLHKVRQHIRLSLQYRASPYPGQVILIRALNEGADGQSPAELSLGWAELARRGLEISILRANHAGLLVPPIVGTLAHELRSYLGSGKLSTEEAAGVSASDQPVERFHVPDKGDRT